MKELKRFECKYSLGDDILQMSLIQNNDGQPRIVIGPRINSKTGSSCAVGNLTIIEYSWLSGRIDEVRMFMLEYFKRR